MDADEDLAMRLMDEEEGIDFQPIRKLPNGGRVAVMVNDYVSRHAATLDTPLVRILRTEVGSDEQRRALYRFWDERAEAACNTGTNLDLIEVNLAYLVSRMSGEQRAKLAVSITHMPWSVSPVLADGGTPQ